MDLFNLKGKTALITGPSNGLGEQFLRCLSQAGARVIMAARNFEKLEALAQEIKNIDSSSFYWTAKRSRWHDSLPPVEQSLAVPHGKHHYD